MRARSALLPALTGALVLLAGCATPGPDAAPDVPAVPAATTAPAVLLSPGHLTTVLDDGDGAELCLGGVLTSLPPQCGGPKLIGWHWADWPGAYEEVGDIRWGRFRVVGTFDQEADVFTPVEIVPEAAIETDAPLPEGTTADLTSPCPEPEGGWRVLDPARTTVQAQEAMLARAATLPNYAGAWVDLAPNAATDQPPSDAQPGWTDPLTTIVNIAVTDDLAGAEMALREVWGGLLCITQAERTEAELRAIQDELTRTPGLLGVGVDAVSGTVGLDVVYDEGGALQAELDARYGPGLVIVTSTLRPVA